MPTVPGVSQAWVETPPPLPTHFMNSQSFLVSLHLDFLTCEMGQDLLPPEVLVNEVKYVKCNWV